jgi:hypothetical protein
VSEPREPLDEFESGLGLSVPIARRVIQAEGGSVSTAAAARTIVVELPVHQV